MPRGGLGGVGGGCREGVVEWRCEGWGDETECRREKKEKQEERKKGRRKERKKEKGKQFNINRVVSFPVKKLAQMKENNNNKKKKQIKKKISTQRNQTSKEGNFTNNI